MHKYWMKLICRKSSSGLILRRIRYSELSSGMYCRVKKLSTDVSEVRTASWWWRQYAPLKRRSKIILHGSTSQKTILNIILEISHKTNKSQNWMLYNINITIINAKPFFSHFITHNIFLLECSYTLCDFDYKWSNVYRFRAWERQ
jgi:hypothetical protein